MEFYSIRVIKKRWEEDDKKTSSYKNIDLGVCRRIKGF